MSKLIFNTKFIKPYQSEAQKYNLIEYVANRLGAEQVPLPEEASAADAPTAKQEEYINRLIKLIPESVELLEFEDYKESPNASTAAALIDSIIYNNFDRISTDRFIDYLAYRPGVQRLQSHGLFSSTNEEINLADVKKEVADLNTNLYTTVVSLRREDAARLCFENVNAWKELIVANQFKLAESFKIAPQDLKWYAAFHNEGHHPHIHLMVYSTGKEGYLTKAGIESFRGTVATDIFKNELYDIYKEQKLTIQSTQGSLRKILADKASLEPVADKLKSLAENLEGYTGRKSYGYLNRSCKKAVDDILRELAAHPEIAKAYEEYTRLKNEQMLLYYTADKVPAVPPIEANEEFKVLRNMVVREAFNLRHELGKEKEEAKAFMHKDDSIPTPISSKKIVADRNLYLLGRNFYTGDGVDQDLPKAIDYLNRAVQSGNTDAAYLLGKILLTEETVKNVPEAIKNIKLAADEEKHYAEYLLGRLYFYGREVPRDLELAREYLHRASEHGNEYADALLDRNPILEETVAAAGLVSSVLRLFESNSAPNRGKGFAVTDRKAKKLKGEKFSDERTIDRT